MMIKALAIPSNRIHLFIVSFYLSTSINMVAQDISSDFSLYRYLNFFEDIGMNWERNSFFKPYHWDSVHDFYIDDSIQSSVLWMIDDLKSPVIQRIIDHKNKKDKLECNAWFGNLLQYSDGDDLQSRAGLSALYGYFHFSYKDYFKAWLYPRITSDQYNLPHYTGEPRPNYRVGLNTGETDMSGIGYFGDWSQVWFGRGRQNWGAKGLDNLAISGNSASYDHVTMQLRFDSLKFRYFHGYLETMDNSNHRYIAGRGIEYNNQSNFVIGLHEIAIYSGIDRPVSISYLNPIATHLEIELNERDNGPGGTGAQNAVWQISTDLIPLQGFRISGNLMFDEIAIDEEHIVGTDTSKSVNNYGYQTRIAYSTQLMNCFTTFDFQNTYVSTYALRHERGSNNFVSRGLPLGSDIGSDGDRWQVGIRVVTPIRIITNFHAGQKRSGINNLLNNLYEPNSEVQNGNFPSGTIEITDFIILDLHWNITNNIHLKIHAQKTESNLIGDQNYIILSLDAFWPAYFEL